MSTEFRVLCWVILRGFSNFIQCVITTTPQWRYYYPPEDSEESEAQSGCVTSSWSQG